MLVWMFTRRTKRPFLTLLFIFLKKIIIIIIFIKDRKKGPKNGLLVRKPFLGSFSDILAQNELRISTHELISNFR